MCAKQCFWAIEKAASIEISKEPERFNEYLQHSGTDADRERRIGLVKLLHAFFSFSKELDSGGGNLIFRVILKKQVT